MLHLNSVLAPLIQCRDTPAQKNTRESGYNPVVTESRW